MYTPPHPPAAPVTTIAYSIADVIYCPVGPVQGPPHPHCLPNVHPPIAVLFGADRDPRGPSIPKCAEHGPNMPGCSMVSEWFTAFVDGRYVPPGRRGAPPKTQGGGTRLIVQSV